LIAINLCSCFDFAKSTCLKPGSTIKRERFYGGTSTTVPPTAAKNRDSLKGLFDRQRRG
jgi:hypothetical protein